MKRETMLWIGAILLFGAGDIATTMFGLQLNGIVESNPLARSAFSHSQILGMVGLKAAAFGILYTGYRIMPTGTRLWIPATLNVAGGAIIMWNLYIITLVL